MRGTVRVDRGEIRSTRLLVAAVVLIAAGVVGAAYKAHVMGGIPLFSAEPDLVRARAVAHGEVVVPTWSTALTNGFHLGMWAALAALWMLPRSASRWMKAALWLLVLAALLGVALGASRNLVLFAVVIPAVAWYLLSGWRPAGRDFAWMTAGLCVLVAGIGGLFVLRVERAESGARTYLRQELDRQPVAVRPLVPVYINVVYPLEAERRLYAAVPQRRPYGLGADSLTSLPDVMFPEGKSTLGSTLAALMGTQLTWTVASYQGRLVGDLGWQGVIFGSILLGLAFGSLQRWARARTALVAVAVTAYVAYYSAFMLYDNLLSFTLIAAFDLMVIVGVAAYCTDRTADELRYLRRPAAT